MKEPKISVIVPIYKVEPYLRKCLDSIVNQTYRNLEIILVDDGSPDNCGAICDEYAAKDQRVRVIHKANGGLSSARNAALEIATGAYIGFVDSDDWIEVKMFEVLLSGLQTAGADISVCGHYEEYKSHRKEFTWPKQLVLDKERALEKLLQNDQMKNLVWDKLFCRNLFDNIRFPEGKTFEDMAIMHWLFLQAEKVVCLPNALYHYLQRSGSIVDDVSLGNRLNHYRAAKERYDALSADWPQFDQLMATQCVASAVGIWAGYLSNPKEERKQYEQELDDIAVFSALHYKEALAHMKLGRAGRIILYLLPYKKWWAFATAYCIAVFYQWKHGRAL